MDKTEHMTAAEYREMMQGGKKRNKYNAQKTEFNGRTYDSKHEANRAAELELLKKAHEVVKVFYQVPFELPGEIKYIADFVIIWTDGHWTVEDAKGVLTDVYKLKKKLMRERYKVEIQEV